MTNMTNPFKAGETNGSFGNENESITKSINYIPVRDVSCIQITDNLMNRIVS